MVDRWFLGEPGKGITDILLMPVVTEGRAFRDCD